jgi:hypothetical protein
MSNASSGDERSRAKKSTKRNARREDALASEGVLANLPRTRPQRSSARREAARRATQAEVSPALAPTALRKRATTKAKATKAVAVKPGQKSAQGAAKPRHTAKRLQEDPAPRQGFESESDPISGPVQPPGGVDLLASAAELAGELAKTGLSTGGRLLKDVLARLPLN